MLPAIQDRCRVHAVRPEVKRGKRKPSMTRLISWECEKGSQPDVKICPLAMCSQCDFFFHVFERVGVSLGVSKTSDDRYWHHKNDVRMHELCPRA